MGAAVTICYKIGVASAPDFAYLRTIGVGTTDDPTVYRRPEKAGDRKDKTMTDLKPRQVSCGCCTGGCSCWMHKRDQRPPHVCAYHQEHTHTRVTETYNPAIHLPQG